MIFPFPSISHKSKIPRNDVSSEETHLGWCSSSRTLMLFKVSNPQGFLWICPLPAAQTPRSLCSQCRFFRLWLHWPLLHPKAFSHCWPHAPGPRQPCLEPRDFVHNATCFQENSPSHTTAFLSDPRKIQWSFAAEPAFSPGRDAAPGSAAWLGSHCWDGVRAERALSACITGVALQLPFAWELHPCPDPHPWPFPELRHSLCPACTCWSSPMEQWEQKGCSLAHVLATVFCEHNWFYRFQ